MTRRANTTNEKALDAFIAAFEAREREREVMYRELLEEPEP